jgi:hypothetical protein
VGEEVGEGDERPGLGFASAAGGAALPGSCALTGEGGVCFKVGVEGSFCGDAVAPSLIFVSFERFFSLSGTGRVWAVSLPS